VLSGFLNNSEELIKIFVTSIKTSRKDDAYTSRTPGHANLLIGTHESQRLSKPTIKQTSETTLGPGILPDLTQ
jgi:hypothetical protein